MDSPWIAALGLMFLLEGGIPLLFPKQWREYVSHIAALADGQIRFVGLVAVLGGLLLLFLS